MFQVASCPLFVQSSHPALCFPPMAEGRVSSAVLSGGGCGRGEAHGVPNMPCVLASSPSPPLSEKREEKIQLQWS